VSPCGSPSALDSLSDWLPDELLRGVEELDTDSDVFLPRPTWPPNGALVACPDAFSGELVTSLESFSCSPVTVCVALGAVDAAPRGAYEALFNWAPVTSPDSLSGALVTDPESFNCAPETVWAEEELEAPDDRPRGAL